MSIKANDTKTIFAEAFCSLYREMPLEKISVQAVARKAGYNRSTFYQYFLDINDILEFVEQDLIDYMQTHRKSEPLTGRENFLENILEIYEKKAIYIDALMGDYGNNSFFNRLKEALRNDVPELRLAENSKIKPYIIEFRLSSSLALFHLWRKRGKDLPANEFLQLVSNLYTEGTSAYLSE